MMRLEYLPGRTFGGSRYLSELDEVKSTMFHACVHCLNSSQGSEAEDGVLVGLSRDR